MSHLGEHWAEFVLGLLPPEEDARCATHVEACPTCQEALRLEIDAVDQLADALPPRAPSAHARERLLRAASVERAFDAFTERLAAMIDRSVDYARSCLDRLGDAEAWAPLMPGIHLMHLEGGPATGAADVGFVRVEPGLVFPHHTHVGRETVLILQGGYVDEDGTTHRAGECLRAQGGSHTFTALPAVPLLYAVVVDGVTFTDHPDLVV